MSRMDVRMLVTGGAGFIGSHLVDSLMGKGGRVTVLDNLSTGSMDNVAEWIGHPNLTFIKGDCLNREYIHKAMEDCGLVFHLAANPEVRVGAVDTEIDVPTVAAAVVAAYAYREMDEGFARDVCAGVVVGSVSLLVEPYVSKFVEGIIKPEESEKETETETEVLSAAETAALREMALLAR